MISPRSLTRIAAVSVAAAALSAPAAQARPADLHAPAPAASHARAHDDSSIDWAEVGYIGAAVAAFGGALGLAVRPRRARTPA